MPYISSILNLSIRKGDMGNACRSNKRCNAGQKAANKAMSSPIEKEADQLLEKATEITPGISHRREAQSGEPYSPILSRDSLSDGTDAFIASTQLNVARQKLVKSCHSAEQGPLSVHEA